MEMCVCMLILKRGRDEEVDSLGDEEPCAWKHQPYQSKLWPRKNMQMQAHADRVSFSCLRITAK